MHISPSLFHGNVKPTTMSLPSTSPAHGSVDAASAVVGVDFCTAFLLHMVDKFIYFLSSSAGKLPCFSSPTPSPSFSPIAYHIAAISSSSSPWPPTTTATSVAPVAFPTPPQLTLLHLSLASSSSPPAAAIAPKRRCNCRRPALSPPALAALLLLCSPSRQRTSRRHLSLLPNRSCTILLSPKLQQPASIPTTISDVPSYHCHRSYLSAPVASRRYRTCSCRQPLLFIPFALSLRSLSPPAI
ncbi:hypothetical protein BHM03_00062891 [Ensete ventricosum]|nr:hypothetical protein BHM03_00062891 [Ensete ventricosum]